MDTFIAAAEVYFIRQDILSPTLITSMQLFTSFTLTLFGLELIALLVIFHINILGHIGTHSHTHILTYSSTHSRNNSFAGYILDFATLIVQIVLELNGSGRETRILNIFRFWRLARLMYSIINVEKDAHNGTKAQLDSKNIELTKMIIENRR